MFEWFIDYCIKVQDNLKENKTSYVPDPKEDALLHDIKNYPHAFVLACCMDRQIIAERAWRIPCVINGLCETFSISELASFPLEWYQKTFNDNKLHLHNNDMARVFYSAVQLINNKYNGDASKIWRGHPSSAKVVSRFLEFDGVGLKIAATAANILHRDLGIEYSDYTSIDVSPDIHISRLFSRIGLTSKNASRDEVVYKARALYPPYPGIIDAACWRTGREHCHPTNPDCKNCPISVNCPKII